MARRGLLAEIHRGLKAAQREAERRNRDAARKHAAAVRRAGQARKANELAEGKSASVTDTLAKVLHALGHKKEACTVLAQAIKLLEDGSERGMLIADMEELGCSS